MTGKPSSRSEADSNRRRWPRGWGLVLLGLLLAYVFFRPALEQRLGVRLPGLTGSRSGETGTPAPAKRSSQPNAESSSQPAADDSPAGRDAREDGPPLGRLTDKGAGVQQSTAGLLYGPGGREEHRLDHVLRHGRDQPDRSGMHGVFDGERDEILALIDEAYQRAQQGGNAARVERQGARVVYTVDMARRIGYVGGREGQRRNHPEARHIRLVLDGRDVITAYPLVP